jgi:hypothetical protein
MVMLTDDGWQAVHPARTVGVLRRYEWNGRGYSAAASL